MNLLSIDFLVSSFSLTPLSLTSIQIIMWLIKREGQETLSVRERVPKVQVEYFRKVTLFCTLISVNSDRKNLLDQVRQMFFLLPPPSPFPPPFENSFSTAQLKSLWKKTHRLRRWRCLGLRITEVQAGSPCHNYSCTKDGTVSQTRAQEDFSGSQEWSRQILKKGSCSLI